LLLATTEEESYVFPFLSILITDILHSAISGQHLCSYHLKHLVETSCYNFDNSASFDSFKGHDPVVSCLPNQLPLARKPTASFAILTVANEKGILF